MTRVSPPREAVMLTLHLVNSAQERGATWADVARALGLRSASDAKNETKRLARRLERELWREAEMTEGSAGGVDAVDPQRG